MGSCSGVSSSSEAGAGQGQSNIAQSITSRGCTTVQARCSRFSPSRHLTERTVCPASLGQASSFRNCIILFTHLAYFYPTFSGVPRVRRAWKNTPTVSMSWLGGCLMAWCSYLVLTHDRMAASSIPVHGGLGSYGV